MKMRKTLGALVLAGAMALGYGGCATTSSFKPVEIVEQVQDGYHATLGRADTNGDKKYDCLFISVEDDMEDKVITNLGFIDKDYDGTLDVVLGDLFDEHGEQFPDGVYDVTLDFDLFYETAFGRPPTAKDAQVDSFYKVLLQGVQ